MNNHVCPSCGEFFDIEQARFCPHCGAALPTEEAAMDVEALENEIMERYRAYAAWAENMHAGESGGRRLLNLFTSNSPFKNSPEHGKFFDSVKEMTEKLLGIYQSGTERAGLCKLLHFALIECHRGIRAEADLMFLAAEQLYLPFLDLLPADAAAAMLPEYKALRKKQKGFEVQTKILKILKTMGNM